MTRTHGSCSVCFASHVLTVRCRPQRHGFAIMGAGRGHGHLGAWHTGPCFGGDYVHLGENCEGTKVALGQAVAHRVGLQEYADRLARRPILSWTWSETVPRSQRGIRVVETKAFEIPPGRESQCVRLMIRDALVPVQVPAYEKLLDERTAQNNAAIADLDQTIETYRKVIAEWAPEKWPTSSDDGKPVAVHLAAKWRFSRKGSETTVGWCSVAARMLPSGQRFTTEHAEVTCGRCLRVMASAAKEKARRAAILRYRVELPDGAVAETTNECQGTKRPLVAAVLAKRDASMAAGLPERWLVDSWCVSGATTKKAMLAAKKWATEVRVVALEPQS